MLLEDLKLKINSALELSQTTFSYPSDLGLGHLSLACFVLAKARKINPANLAQDLVLNLKDNQQLKKYFFDIKAVGPYLNFFIRPEYLAEEIISAIRKEKNSYGQNRTGKKQKIMIEYSNGNTHKEYHIGHLRNIAYGDAVNHLLEASGYHSIPVSYINDFGLPVAKTIWNWYRNPDYSKSSESRGYLLGRCYAEANKLLANNAKGREEVTAIMKEIESRQGKSYKFWQISRQWSIDYFDSIYKELAVKFVHIFYESEVIMTGLDLVKDLISRGIFVKSQGAIIANLEEYDLGVLPIIRTDGTALYVVADLALASEKFKKYDLDQSIYVVDVRQSLYFKQLFKILELMGYKQPMHHLTYDFVTLPGGMMSSRTGNIITYQKLKDQISSQLWIETKKRHSDWSDNQIRKVVNNLSLATMKFEMLKVSADKIITFDISEAIKFEGYTACYIQYSYARFKNIIRKGEFKMSGGKQYLNELQEIKEQELLLKLAKYPEIIRLATEKYNPSELTKYLFELAQLANDYYHKINILKSENKKRKARLNLISAVSQIIANGFNIIGIKTLERM